jgi:hypothetical protein
MPASTKGIVMKLDLGKRVEFRPALPANLGGSLLDSLARSLRVSLWDHLWISLGDSLGDSLWDSLDERNSRETRSG